MTQEFIVDGCHVEVMDSWHYAVIAGWQHGDTYSMVDIHVPMNRNRESMEILIEAKVDEILWKAVEAHKAFDSVREQIQDFKAQYGK